MKRERGSESLGLLATEVRGCKRKDTCPKMKVSEPCCLGQELSHVPSKCLGAEGMKNTQSDTERVTIGEAKGKGQAERSEGRRGLL